MSPIIKMEIRIRVKINVIVGFSDIFVSRNKTVDPFSHDTQTCAVVEMIRDLVENDLHIYGRR